MKEFLYRLDGILMTILALPGIIVGLPYLLREQRQQEELKNKVQEITHYNAYNQQVTEEGEDPKE